MRILLVEDNQVLSEGLSALLRGSGYAVDVVSDGASADAAIAAESFDLVILDLNLPGISWLLRNTRLFRLPKSELPSSVIGTGRALTSPNTAFSLFIRP